MTVCYFKIIFNISKVLTTSTSDSNTFGEHKSIMAGNLFEMQNEFSPQRKDDISSVIGEIRKLKKVMVDAEGQYEKMCSLISNAMIKITGENEKLTEFMDLIGLFFNFNLSEKQKDRMNMQIASNIVNYNQIIGNTNPVQSNPFLRPSFDNIESDSLSDNVSVTEIFIKLIPELEELARMLNGEVCSSRCIRIDDFSLILKLNEHFDIFSKYLENTKMVVISNYASSNDAASVDESHEDSSDDEEIVHNSADYEEFQNVTLIKYKSEDENDDEDDEKVVLLEENDTQPQRNTSNRSSQSFNPFLSDDMKFQQTFMNGNPEIFLTENEYPSFNPIIPSENVKDPIIALLENLLKIKKFSTLIIEDGSLPENIWIQIIKMGFLFQKSSDGTLFISRPEF